MSTYTRADLRQLTEELQAFRQTLKKGPANAGRFTTTTTRGGLHSRLAGKAFSDQLITLSGHYGQPLPSREVVTKLAAELRAKGVDNPDLTDLRTAKIFQRVMRGTSR